MKTLKFKLLILIFTIADIKASTRNLIENGPNSCGKVKKSFGSIFNGSQTQHGEYPWNAALVRSEDLSFFCGGTLVSNNLVVTAAHCVEEKGKTHNFVPKDIFVILGAHNLAANSEIGVVIEAVKEIHKHHEWNPYSPAYDADIAILELRKKVTFSEYIQPICIAEPNSEAALKTEGVLVGFGTSERTGYGNTESIARKIPSPIHSYEFCVNSSDHNNLVTHRTFCGGYANGTSVCRGDSGSGLIVQHEGISYLRGIVSSGISDLINGCNITSYSIFTDILEFYSWITTGKDEKTLIRELIEENNKLKAKNQELLDQMAELELHTTTEKSNEKIPKTPKCQDSEGFLRECRVSEIKCKNYEKFTQKLSFISMPVFSIRKEITNKCQHKATSLIFGGTEAKRYEFPHHALLGYENSESGTVSWRCSGSLVSPNFVLTAAQCTRSRRNGQIKYVKLGMSEGSQTDERVLTYGIEEIFMHPNYLSNQINYIIKNDIALLKLNDTVKFNEYLYPICLPTIQPEDQKAVLTGFGRTGKYEPQSNALLKVTAQRFSHSECQKLIPKFKINPDSQLCFGNQTGAPGSCGGDAGGPLQVGNDNFAKCTYTIIGINSFGPIDCEIIGIPDVYTNVFHYLDWIEEIVWRNEA